MSQTVLCRRPGKKKTTLFRSKQSGKMSNVSFRASNNRRFLVVSNFAKYRGNSSDCISSHQLAFRDAAHHYSTRRRGAREHRVEYRYLCTRERRRERRKEGRLGARWSFRRITGFEIYRRRARGTTSAGIGSAACATTPVICPHGHLHPSDTCK